MATGYITSHVITGNATSPRNWSGQSYDAIRRRANSPLGYIPTVGNSRIETNGGTSGVTTSFLIGPMRPNFATMDSGLKFVSTVEVINLVDDTLTLSARIVNGATILAAADAGGTSQTFVSRTTAGSVVVSTAFTYVNTTANKAAWDGAQIELTQNYTTNMGGDSGYISIPALHLEGTYTTTGTETGIYLIGDNIEFANSASQPATVITLPRTIPVGDVLIARIANSSSALGLSISDPGGNTWNVLGPATITADSVTSQARIAYAVVTTELSSGQNIVFTWGGGLITDKAISISQWRGIATNSPLANTETIATANSTSFSLSHAAANVDDLIITSRTVSGALLSYSYPSGWQDLNMLHSSTTNNALTTTGLYGAYKIATDTTSQTWSGSSNTAQKIAMIAAAFKLQPDFFTITHSVDASVVSIETVSHSVEAITIYTPMHLVPNSDSNRKRTLLLPTKNTNLTYIEAVVFGDSGTASRQIAQGIVPDTNMVVNSLSVWMIKGGTPSDTLTIEIVDDLDSVTPIRTMSMSLSSLTGSETQYTFNFSDLLLIGGTQYYIRFRRSSTSSSNYPAIGAMVEADSYYSAGSIYRKNNSDVWIAATPDIAIKLSHSGTNWTTAGVSSYEDVLSPVGSWTHSNALFGEASGGTQGYAQSFTLTESTVIDRIQVNLSKVNSPVDGIYLQLRSNVNNITQIIATSNTISQSSITGTMSTYSFDIYAELLPGQYYIVVLRTGSSSINYYFVGSNNSNVYSGGSLWNRNSSSVWVEESTKDLFFIIQKKPEVYTAVQDGQNDSQYAIGS